MTNRGEAATKSFTSDDVLPKQLPTFKFALQLAFSMLSHALQQLTHKSSQYSHSNLNPHLAILFAFPSAVLKHRPTLDVLKCSIPWEELGAFFVTVSGKIAISWGLMSEPDKSYSCRNVKRWVVLTGGCTSLLVEDWLRIGACAGWNGSAARSTSAGSGRAARNANQSLRFWRSLKVANSKMGQSRMMTAKNPRKRALQPAI